MTNWTEAIGRPLRALHLDSLKKQVLVLAAAAAFLPALAMLVVASRRNRGSLDQEIAPALRGASAEASWEIDRWLADRFDDLRVAATSYAVTDNLPRLQGRGAAEALGRLKDYLNSARERSSDCEALVLLDPHGRVVTASGGRMSGVQFSLERLNGLRTGDLLVGDAYWDTGIGKAAITLAVPIRQPDGRLAGALTAKFNLRAVGDLLQQAAPDSGGDAYVMTDQGRMVLRSDGGSADLMKIRLPPRTLEALLDKPGTMVASTGADGRDALATLRRLPALHWAVVVELPRGRALRQAGGTGAGTVVLLVFLVAAVGAIAGLCGWLVIRPVERLTRAAAQVAAGDLSVDIPTGGGGEVGQLTNVFRHLVTRVRERDGQGELERLSVTDALTGLYNRRHLMGTLANEVQRSRRLRRTFSVLLADVDHFKQYNDTHGHLAGDAVLVKVAEILRQTTRGVDSVARYGGEEFVVMLIEAPLATALIVAERIRARVAAEPFPGGRLSVSVGTAEYPTHGDTPEELIASADAAMYQAKGGGRDRVAAASLSPAAAQPAEKAVKKRRKGEA